MRPGMLLGLYLLLLVSNSIGAAMLGAISVSSTPPAIEYILVNWPSVKAGLHDQPYAEPLSQAQSVAAGMDRLAVCALLLAATQALGLLNVSSLLSRRGARALWPFALHASALLLGALTVAAGFVYGPVGCLASPIGCTAVKGTNLCALLLGVLAVARCVHPHPPHCRPCVTCTHTHTQ
jgi:hypothetical protein